MELRLDPAWQLQVETIRASGVFFVSLVQELSLFGNILCHFDF